VSSDKNLRRIVPLGIAILFVALQRTLFAADTGVPAGWSALQCDNYGNDLLNKHQYVQSRKYFDAAIRVEPDRWTAYFNRSTAFRLEGNLAAALQDLNTTIRLKPAFFEASWDRALVCLELHNYAASLKDFNALERVTFEVGQTYQRALTLMRRGRLRASCPDPSIRNGKLAITDAKTACELTHWKRATYIDTLAAAYAESGDFNSAVRYQEQAISLNNSPSDESEDKMDKKASDKENEAKRKAPGFSQRLQLYKQHRPYRDTK
jgi:tetratricopeptide (TPR) repeat protein